MENLAIMINNRLNLIKIYLLLITLFAFTTHKTF